MYFAMEAPDLSSDDPQDRMMIRSRIDVLIETPDGLQIVDYKTDRVREDGIEARAEMYRPQMEMYRKAIETITGRKVTAIHMVFLSARRSVLA